MVAPLIPLAVQAIASIAPSLIRIFGKSEVSERNARAAEIVVQAAKEATGAVNEQDLITKIEEKSPETVKAVQEAVEKVWYEISVSTEGVEAARVVNQASGQFWKLPAIWVTAALLPLAYIVVMAVLGIKLPYLGTVTDVAFDSEIRAMVIAAVISGVLGGITGFWLGTSFSSQRKTEIISKS